MIKKRLLIVLFLIISIPATAYIKNPDEYKISPEKNAYWHNNLGIAYANEGIYDVAIEEFKIALSLSPATQASAVYANNLGELYMKLNYPKAAREFFEHSIKYDRLNFLYYKNLAECYKALGIANIKIKEYSKNDGNSLNMIMLGLLYEQIGEKRKAIIKLDEFVMCEPDLIITQGVKSYLKELAGS